MQSLVVKINSTVSDEVLPCPTEKLTPRARKEGITVPVGKSATEGKDKSPRVTFMDNHGQASIMK